jgi:histidine ammonia-lyase
LIDENKTMKFILKPGQLKLSDLRLLLDENTTLELNHHCYAKINAAEKLVAKTLANGKTVYGVNTGFGALAHTRIPKEEIETLQRSLVLSHAAGTGELLSDQAVRLILALKINSLARGFSGVRRETIDALIQFFNHHLYPCIPSQGSVGASGDLAPLAHLSSALLGVGEVRSQGKTISAKEALKKIHLQPLHFTAKEGLALVNGTQVSTALALLGLFAIEDVFDAALIAGSLSLDAARGSDVAFDERIQEARGHPTQIQVASIYRSLLRGSEVRESHRHCDKVQDPYSLRCQPQVMGACLSSILYAKDVLLIEANAVSDNPLIFVDQGEILSGGNFHAEPVALVADALAVAIAEIASLSERRIALLVDPNFSGLPAFLVENPGINSGFMIAQVTAASLASENKTYAHPASVDSLPTSANQEDHVSMATFAARRLLPMAENAATIVGIELLAAAQGIDLLHPQKTSPKLEKIHKLIRGEVKFYDKDRFFAPDIAKIKALVKSGRLRNELPYPIFPDLQSKHHKTKNIKMTTHG